MRGPDPDPKEQKMNILEEAASAEDGQGLGAVKPKPKYLSSKAPQDFVMEVTECDIRLHENEENANYGQPFFLLAGRIVESSTATGSEKIQGAWTDVDLRVGDTIGKTIELGTARKLSEKKWALRDMARMAASFSEDGANQDDFLTGGRKGPAAISNEVFSDAGKFVGRQVHVYTNGAANDRGYYNDLRFDLVPQGSKKKK